MDRRVHELADALGLEVSHQVIRTAAEAQRLGFRGSPTVLVDGTDPFASEDHAGGLTCRLYDTPNGPAGAPTVDQLRQAMGGQRDVTAGGATC